MRWMLMMMMMMMITELWSKATCGDLESNNRCRSHLQTGEISRTR